MNKKMTYGYQECFLLAVMILCLNVSYSQNFADKSYYLIDSLNLEKLSLKEQKLINNSLKSFHNTKHDTLKIKAINIIVEESWDDTVWPRYNKWLHSYIQEKLAGYSSKNNKGPIIEKLTKSLGETLNNTGVFYSNEGNYEKALEYYNKSLKIMEGAGYKKEIAVTLNNIGYIHLTQGKAVKALEFYLNSLSIKKEIYDEKGIANSLNNIAQIYYDHGDITKALEYNIKSLKIKEKLKDDRGISASLNNIAVIYFDMEDRDKALEYHLKSLELNETIGDKKMIVVILSNIGLIYTGDGDFQKGLEYYNKALKISESVSDKHGLIYSLKNIGEVYSRKGENEKALAYFKKSLSISEKIGDKKEIASLWYQMASVYLKKNQISSAKISAKKSMDLAKELGYPLRIRDAAEVLKVIYQIEKNWEEAFNMQGVFITMKDSLNNEKTEKSAIRQQAKYDLEKKELELSKSEQEVELLSSQNEIQELKLNRNRILMVLFSIAFGLVSILILLVFRGNKKKKVIYKLLKKQKEDISKKNEEKTILLKEIHHRVKNNLQVVNSLLKFQSREIEDKKILGMFEKAQKRVLSMAMLHEKLYRSDDLKNINIKDHFTVLIEDLIKNYAVDKKINLEINIEDIANIGIETLTSLGLIISELITNSLKHAFKNTSQGTIIVSLKQVNVTYELIIGDDGVGFVPKKESGGLGTKLTQIFTKQLGGTITKLNQPGTVFKIEFKKLSR